MNSLVWRRFRCHGFFAAPQVQQHWSDEVWEPGDLTVTGSPNS